MNQDLTGFSRFGFFPGADCPPRVGLTGAGFTEVHSKAMLLASATIKLYLGWCVFANACEGYSYLQNRSNSPYACLFGRL